MCSCALARRTPWIRAPTLVLQVLCTYECATEIRPPDSAQEAQQRRAQETAYHEMRSTAHAAWRVPPCSATAHEGWNNFTPTTNCVWLAYLCDVVRLQCFGKAVPMSKADRKALDTFRCAPSHMSGIFRRLLLIKSLRCKEDLPVRPFSQRLALPVQEAAASAARGTSRFLGMQRSHIAKTSASAVAGRLAWRNGNTSWGARH